MNAAHRNEALREIFKAAIEPGTSKAGGQHHPVDDDDLLLDWSVGDLTPERHRAVLDHLAECAYCRRELADMVRAGALVLPKYEDDDEGDTTAESTPAVRRPQEAARSKRNLLIAVAALAASLLVAVIWGVSNLSDDDSIVALARQDLDAGRHDAAFDRIERYLDENRQLADDNRAAASQILEEAGYQIASQDLRGDDADRRRVLDIEARTARHDSGSGRLSNLRIQAERGESSEHSLSRRPSLTDYGYQRDGQEDPFKGGIVPIDDTMRRIEQEFATAVEKHPDSIDLRLNFGQFYLEQNDFDRAAEQFATAAKIDPENATAQTGLGLALFQQEDSEAASRALLHFRRAVELSPNDPAANLNLAICLTRLGRTEEAQPYFEKAPE